MTRIVTILMVFSAIMWPQIHTILIMAAEDQPIAIAIAKPGCVDKCGDVKIPFPFGMGDGCFYNYSIDGDSFYKVTCSNSVDGGKDQLSINGTSLFNISKEDHSFRVNFQASWDCYNSTGDRNSTNYFYLSIPGFSISPTKNKLVATGCDTKGYFEGKRYGDYFFTGCLTYCLSMDNITDGACNGAGCCESTVPDGINVINPYGKSWSSHLKAPFNPCSSIFVVENDAYTFSTTDLTAPDSHFENLFYPVLFDWSILGNGSCNQHTTLCGSNTTCIDQENINSTISYRCKCWVGYDGNPYLSQGCQDVDECLDKNTCEKPEYCVNTPGSHYCRCPKGFLGNATREYPCTAKGSGWNSLPIGVRVTIGLAIGLMLFLVGGIFGCLHYQNKQFMDEQASFFKKNGGLILDQNQSGQEKSVQKFKIFSSDELQIATDYYSESNRLGIKGEGSKVYKGKLQGVDQEIAVKTSIEVDPKQISQFINETLLLSEINNKNVVKLLGCCLDTEVPFLVYEFIDNGTLYEHLQDEKKAPLLLSDTRMCIAEAVASVLSYLHTTIAISIIHGDIKSACILLDKKCTAKLAGFGASKVAPNDDKDEQAKPEVSIDHEYLDPEYKVTKVFTKKSDVYSFGVVLVELLSGRRPDAVHFVCKMEEGRLSDLVDHSIWMNDQQVEQVAKLARRCLRPTGAERPTMKEVAMELEYIRIRGASKSSSIIAPIQEESDAFLTEYNKGNSTAASTSSKFTSKIQPIQG